jgi:5-methylcytosine-specific restriction endonuclease McrA
MGRLTTLKSKLQIIPRQLVVVSADSWRADKQSSTARGYGYKWQQARAAYLVKHPFCVYCLREAGISDSQDVVSVGMECMTKGMRLPYAQVVDHIVAHKGDMTLFWDSNNWQSLCSTHHSRDKQREEARA